jgi:hypothetical protein
MPVQPGASCRDFKLPVIARRVWPAVAIQLDCFVVPQGGAPRNDGLKIRPKYNAIGEK